jgi:hypothetical protein
MALRLVVVSLSLCITTVMAAQSGTGTAQDQPPTFKAQTNFVRVDVYPTRNGKPVDDLRAEDFEVQEDGAPQTITAFGTSSCNASLERSNQASTCGSTAHAAVQSRVRALS